MQRIKSRRLTGWPSRLGLAGLLALALQLIAPIPPAVTKTAEFLAFVAKSGLADLAGPDQSIDLCSHDGSRNQHQATHNNCLLCLVSGIPPGQTELAQHPVAVNHPVAEAPSQQVCGQRTWPTELATGPPALLSI
jgi:hypothetical protein